MLMVGMILCLFVYQSLCVPVFSDFTLVKSQNVSGIAAKSGKVLLIANPGVDSWNHSDGN